MDIEPRSEVCHAIKNKLRIAFIYHDQPRIGEPQCYGINHKDHEALRVHLIKGGKRPEQMFTFDKIEDFKVLSEKFFLPGPNYKKDDADMKVIFCQL